MRLVVLGLSLSSSWGNGHATTYRALLRAFANRGHEILFLERDVPWYAPHRDLAAPDFCQLAFYGSRLELAARWAHAVADADAVIVGSYVPEGLEIGGWVQAVAGGVVAFYDIDTPVTLAKLAAGDEEYLSADIIPRYDLYLSFTGGPTLKRLEQTFGSPMARALYCSVDAATYRPMRTAKRWDLSYLGTYSGDRQPTLQRLLIEVARTAPNLRFCVAGPQYPASTEWPANVERIEHVAPAEHPAFYAASRFALNVTRADMIEAGYSPSVRLFEAAACATPIISDPWDGLQTLFVEGREVLVARDGQTVLDALKTTPEAKSATMGQAARKRVLKEHTAEHRAAQLDRHLADAAARRDRPRAKSQSGLEAAL